LQLLSVHGLPSSHTTGAAAWQLPAPHASPDVQAFPSSQGAALSVNTHPVAGEQESLVQPFPSSQVTGPPGRQLPPPQRSPEVQASPSLHATVLFGWKHPVTGSHASSVHTLPSAQVTAVVSVNTQPVPGSQLSAVQTLLSLQMIGLPA
jgi:hypothetical protein